MKYLISIVLCFLTYSVNAEKENEPEKNAIVLHDGDGLTVLFYYGHYYIINPEHADMCPCKAALH